MSAEYSVEEAIQAADWISHMRTPFKGVLEVAARAYAERIGADESAVTDEVVQIAVRAFRKAFATDGVSGLKKITFDAMRTTLLAVWPHPPAQPAQPAQEQPGWKWVPVEPTPQMVDATWEHIQDKERSDIPESQGRRNKRIYAAMLAASPTPPKEN